MFDRQPHGAATRPAHSPAHATTHASAHAPAHSSVHAAVPLPIEPALVPGDRPSSSRARGFAAMDKDRQRQIASAGGRAAHECGNAHEFTIEEARSAGRKGGMSISQNREHMATIGSKGGMTRGERQRERISDAI